MAKAGTIDSRKVHLHVARSIAREELADLEKFVSWSERGLREEREGFNRHLNDRVSCLPTADQEVEIGWFAEDVDRLSNAFPRILRYSLFVSSLGMIESRLRSFCRLAKQICDTELSASDLKGHGISQSLDYFVKVCRFRIHRTARSDYTHLKKLQKMRNSIIHNEGRPSGNDLATIKQYRKQNPHFDVSERHQIGLSAQFIHSVTRTAESFYETLFAELDKRLRRS